MFVGFLIKLRAARGNEKKSSNNSRDLRNRRSVVVLLTLLSNFHSRDQYGYGFHDTSTRATTTLHAKCNFSKNYMPTAIVIEV